MPAILIDDDLHAHIVRNAKLYVDRCESDTLRRLLGIEEKRPTPPAASAANGRVKKRKVDLFELKQAGTLHDGQRLFLHDYKGNRVEGFYAEVDPLGKLISGGRRYSMSALASTMLKKRGYVADSVRGPAHWYTEQGVSVLDLWRRKQSSR